MPHRIDAERIMIESASPMTLGNGCAAATRLGYGRNTLTQKLKELDLQGRADIALVLSIVNKH